MGENEKPSRKEIMKREAASLRNELAKTVSLMITSAFGLVAAFAWNEVVKDAIDRYISPGEGLKSRLIYAVFVTLLAVLVSYEASKLAARYKKEDEEADK